MIRELRQLYALIGIWSFAIAIVALSGTGIVLAVLWLTPWLVYRYRADGLTTLPFQDRIGG